MKAKNLNEFMECTAKLTPMEFLGVAKMLDIDLNEYTESLENENLGVLLGDMFKKFDALSRGKRRKILQLLKRVVKGRGFYHRETEEVENNGDEC